MTISIFGPVRAQTTRLLRLLSRNKQRETILSSPHQQHCAPITIELCRRLMGENTSKGWSSSLQLLVTKRLKYLRLSPANHFLHDTWKFKTVFFQNLWFSKVESPIRWGEKWKDLKRLACTTLYLRANEPIDQSHSQSWSNCIRKGGDSHYGRGDRGGRRVPLPPSCCRPESQRRQWKWADPGLFLAPAWLPLQPWAPLKIYSRIVHFWVA